MARTGAAPIGAGGACFTSVDCPGKHLTAETPWLAAGRDSLTVSNASLDMALREVVHSVFRKEVVFSAS
jgi:hypothetical protein